MIPPTLKELLHTNIVSSLLPGPHDTMADKLTELGLTEPPRPETAESPSKRERIKAALCDVPDAGLVPLGENYLRHYPPAAPLRNQLQDLIWATQAYPEIPRRIRRDLAHVLIAPLFQDYEQFVLLLDRLWILDDIPYSFFGEDDTQSLRKKIDRHVGANPDWSAEEIFKEVGSFGAHDRRFALFLEGLASAEVCVEEPAQRAFVRSANETLKRCAAELRETGSDGGYPVFRLLPLTAGPTRKPKNLIFASSTKPDLRLSNAVDNDIEIVSQRDAVLVYTDPIGDNGLTWGDLQSWWMREKTILVPADGKKTLYLRLKKSLPSTSPPQTWFFDAFHLCFRKDIPVLPALLPEVWLHWDPQTAKARGADALLRFRMDFLMLLPNRARVVLEIDGQHHYADGTGRADPKLYAKMTVADREQRLAGYEIYRFGAAELGNETITRTVVCDFFAKLFDRHKIPCATPGADLPTVGGE